MLCESGRRSHTSYTPIILLCSYTRIAIVSRAGPHCCVERDTSRLPLVEHIEMENINIIIKLF